MANTFDNTVMTPLDTDSINNAIKERLENISTTLMQEIAERSIGYVGATYAHKFAMSYRQRAKLFKGTMMKRVKLKKIAKNSYVMTIPYVARYFSPSSKYKHFIPLTKGHTGNIERLADLKEWVRTRYHDPNAKGIMFSGNKGADNEHNVIQEAKLTSSEYHRALQDAIDDTYKTKTRTSINKSKGRVSIYATGMQAKTDKNKDLRDRKVKEHYRLYLSKLGKIR